MQNSLNSVAPRIRDSLVYLVCALLVTGSFLTDLLVFPLGWRTVPNDQLGLLVVLGYFAALVTSLLASGWKPVIAVLIGIAVAFIVVPIGLVFTSSADFIEITLPARFVALILLSGSAIFGSYVKRDAARIRLLNATLESRVAERTRALRVVESRLTEAQKMARVGNWETDLTTFESWWSDETYRLIGLDPNESVASRDSFLSTIHPDDRQRVQSAIGKTLQGFGPLSVAHRVLLPDGDVRYLQDEAKLVVDNEGQPLRIIGTLQDVTERVVLEQEIVAIAERERIRIGNDLHDSLAQELTGLTLLIGSLRSRVSKEGSDEDQEFRRIHSVLESAIESSRSMAQGLSPQLAGGTGIKGILDSIAVYATSLYGVEIDIDIESAIPKATSVQTREIYRIVQEAVTNAVRHGEATYIEASVTCEGAQLELTIRDNGRGFDPSSQRDTGMGLRIMAYRANRLGGSLEIGRDATRGTIVTCRCPWGADTRNGADSDEASSERERGLQRFG